MFLILPLAIAGVSLLIVSFIIIRKFAYLKRLAPDVLETMLLERNGFFQELIPDAYVWWRSVNKPTEIKLRVLARLERILHGFRTLATRIDIFTHKLIGHVRRSSKETEKVIIQEERQERIEKAEALAAAETDDPRVKLKEEEQMLIIEIAKNPRDAELYKRLGDIYIRTEEFDDARQSYETALELDPNDASVQNKLARVRYKLAPAYKPE